MSCRGSDEIMGSEVLDFRSIISSRVTGFALTSCRWPAIRKHDSRRQQQTEAVRVNEATSARCSNSMNCVAG